MGCLIDTIGLAGCGTNDPVSGISINSFAGISLESIDAIAENEQVDYVGVWTDVQANAERKLYSLFASKMAERYKLNNPSQSIDLGKNSTTTTTALASEYRGVLFDLNKSNPMPAIYQHSVLQSHYVQSISLYSDGTHNNVAIKFVNGDTGEVLKSMTKNLVIDWNTFSVASTFSCQKLAVVYDSAAINSKGLEIPAPYTWNHDCTAAINGVKFGYSELPKDGDLGNDTFGMSVIYGVRCKFENIICNNLDIFYLPYAYQCAIELTVQRQFSPRINRWTLTKDEAEALRLVYEKDFDTLFDNICNQIDLNLNDCCLECNSPVQVIESIP